MIYRIDLEPIGKGRPRVTRTGHAYTPQKTRTWAEAARLMLYGQHGGRKAMDGPLAMDIIAVFTRTKSRSRKGDPDGRIWHTVKPDVDNIEKAVLDAMTKAGIMRDDAQVACLFSRKMWGRKGEAGHVVVIVEPMPSETVPGME